ncbi:hypothetical protein H8K20_06430 [Neobittarella massiliensis]|uniref:Uncharacterized protein n=1 Tax=Neobittarella massiliensis (ex Bilen et al. 2018) TaxID=2041842 RepID=A0A8J6LUV2_9FIRM|nr:hypothetical protein [Neobittarella massiliensis]MBC3516030.1 hypothetical protein [Neobittarella massiliensis]
MRLIDADAAVDRYYTEWEKVDICDGAQDRDWLKQCIDEAPTIDPEDLRPRGRWIEKPYLLGITRYCSKCGENYGMPHGVFNYCPNCGAKMIEEVPNG